LHIVIDLLIAILAVCVIACIACVIVAVCCLRLMRRLRGVNLGMLQHVFEVYREERASRKSPFHGRI
jgi:hypothetical protein